MTGMGYAEITQTSSSILWKNTGAILQKRTVWFKNKTLVGYVKKHSLKANNKHFFLRKIQAGGNALKRVIPANRWI